MTEQHAEQAQVDPEWIKAQREAGWPDMHPEDYCHRCGRRNPMWFTDAATWATATATWAAETGREGICCPSCLAEMHEAATGVAITWEVRMSTAVFRGDGLASGGLEPRTTPASPSVVCLHDPPCRRLDNGWPACRSTSGGGS